MKTTPKQKRRQAANNTATSTSAINQPEKPATQDTGQKSQCCISSCLTWLTWRRVAVGTIIIFLLIFFCGIFRLSHFRSSFINPIDAQNAAARDAVYSDLAAKYGDAESYKITVSDKIMRRDFRKEREFGRDRNPANEKDILMVFADREGERNVYMLDADNAEIVMHTRTEIYSWMKDYGYELPPFPQPFQGFGHRMDERYRR